MHLFLMHGLPGSGKSYKAKTLCYDDYILLSTDFFWIKDKAYNFDAKYLGPAHEWTRLQCLYHMFHFTYRIIIDNTNLTVSECSPYFLLAKKFGYTFSIIEPDTSWKDDSEICHTKYTHGVPFETIERMQMKKAIN